MDFYNDAGGTQFCLVQNICFFGYFYDLDWYLTPSPTSQEGGLIAMVHGKSPVISSALCRALGNAVLMNQSKHYLARKFPVVYRKYLAWLQDST